MQISAHASQKRGRLERVFVVLKSENLLRQWKPRRNTLFDKQNWKLTLSSFEIPTKIDSNIKILICKCVGNFSSYLGLILQGMSFTIFFDEFNLPNAFILFHVISPKISLNFHGKTSARDVAIRSYLSRLNMCARMSNNVSHIRKQFEREEFN